jgi:hypothetical protein
MKQPPGRLCTEMSELTEHIGPDLEQKLDDLSVRIQRLVQERRQLQNKLKFAQSRRTPPTSIRPSKCDRPAKKPLFFG